MPHVPTNQFKAKICLVAVDIRSTHNIGSLFRTCDGFGADAVLVGISPSPLHDNDSRLPHLAVKANKDIAKTALGAEKTVKWQKYDTFHSAVTDLKTLGYSVVGIEQSTSSKNLQTLDPNIPTALVFGREVTGLTADEMNLCDELYQIPMQGSKESFNVSVAAGIALYQVS